MELGRWIFTTILGRNNNKKSIFNVYHPGNATIELVGNSTVIKQQWVLLQQLNQKGHPRDIIIDDLIKDIKEKQQHNHDIILTIDGNEIFTSLSRGITKV